MFRASMADGTKCDFCGKLEEKHFGSHRFCYLPVYTESEEEGLCANCGVALSEGNSISHYTAQYRFCYDGQRRDAIEDARKKNFFKMDLEEDVGGGKTPLLRAAEKGEISTVRQLIAAGADINHADKMGRSPLHYAASVDKILCTHLLLAAGAPIGILTSANRSALHLAILGNQERIAQELLSVAGGPDMVPMRDKPEGRNCLYLAADKGMEQLALDLLFGGGRELLMSETADGRSALHAAAERGCPKLCKRMLEIGGPSVVKIIAADGRTCLHCCAAMPWIPRKKPADVEAEHALLQRQRDMELVCERMVQMMPVDVLGAADSSKRSALHYCAGSGLAKTCLDTLERLRGHKIEVVSENDDQGEHTVEQDVLRATVMLRSEDGRTSLHMAAAKGLVGVVEQLLAIGGKQLACLASSDGRTSLHWAAGMANTECERKS
jgi:ankyrin repeat protein